MTSNCFSMITGILVLLIGAAISFYMIDSMKQRFSVVDVSLMRNLYFYHFALSFVYYLYALFNPSDSAFYYEKVVINFRGDNWFAFYGTSTTFIEFVGYPFIKFLGFSYEAMMSLFSLFGFIGFLHFHVFFKENIKFKHTLLGADLVTIIFFLPNLHFWSGSFGKGSIILMGIGMFFFGISHLKQRWVAVIIGGYIIYHVRPHIMLVMLVSSAIGFVFTTKGISTPLRIAFLIGVGVTFYFIYGDVLSLVGIDEEEFVSQGLDLTHRATELSKATSGVDITSYSLPLKLFTFLYRPLFVDAPGVLGMIVSFENIFYLLITFRLLSLKGIQYLITSNFLVKTAFFSFLTVSIALAQVSGNLGLAIRQKSQIMLLFMFVIIAFLDNKKLEQYRRALLAKAKRQKLENILKQRAI